MYLLSLMAETAIETTTHEANLFNGESYSTEILEPRVCRDDALPTYSLDIVRHRT